MNRTRKSHLLTLAFLLSLVAGCAAKQSDSSDPVATALLEMDEACSEVVPWLAALYDPATGGFFHAESSRQLEGFEPTIESTAQSVAIVDSGGVLPHLPESVRSAIVSFFQSRQDPESGFFLDRSPIMRASARTRFESSTKPCSTGSRDCSRRYGTRAGVGDSTAWSSTIASSRVLQL